MSILQIGVFLLLVIIGLLLIVATVMIFLSGKILAGSILCAITLGYLRLAQRQHINSLK